MLPWLGGTGRYYAAHRRQRKPREELDGQRDHRRVQPNHQRYAASEQEARQHVASELIGAEPVAHAGWIDARLV